MGNRWCNSARRRGRFNRLRVGRRWHLVARDPQHVDRDRRLNLVEQWPHDLGLVRLDRAVFVELYVVRPQFVWHLLVQQRLDNGHVDKLEQRLDNGHVDKLELDWLVLERFERFEQLEQQRPGGRRHSRRGYSGGFCHGTLR